MRRVRLFLSLMLAIALCFGVLSVASGEAAQPKSGGTVVVGKMDNFTLNYLQPLSETHDVTVTGEIYETLIKLDHDGATILPGLAESWEIPDDKTFIFHLRQGVQFHDGTPFNAEAVKFCFDWYRSEERTPKFITQLACLENVEVVDEYTVKMTTNVTAASFFSSLCEYSGYIASPTFLQEHEADMATMACGTGPFKVDSYIEGNNIKLVRNENYYLKDEAGVQLPYLDGLEYRLMSDSTALCNNVLSGDVDVVDYISITDVPTVDGVDGITCFTSGGAVNPYSLFFNTAQAPYDDVRVRQAICYSINYEELCEAITGGYGQVAAFPIVKGTYYYSDEGGYYYDPEKAKELLAEAGYPDGFETKLVCISRSPDNEIVQILQSYLADIGISITIDAYERTAFNAVVAKSNPDTPSCMMLAKGTLPKYDIWYQIDSQFGRYDANWTKWETDEFYSYIDALDASLDPEVRKESVRDIQNTILGNALAAFLFQQPMVSVANNDVQNIYRDYTGRIMYWNAWLDR